MNWLDISLYGCAGFILVVPLWLVAALALRVSCHFVKLEIPALGRAMLLVLAVTAPPLAIGWAVQQLLLGGQGAHLLSIIAIVISHFGISIITYVRTLNARFSQSLVLWLVSTLLGAAGIGCCVAIMAVPLRYLLRD